MSSSQSKHSLLSFCRLVVELSGFEALIYCGLLLLGISGMSALVKTRRPPYSSTRACSGMKSAGPCLPTLRSVVSESRKRRH